MSEEYDLSNIRFTIPHVQTYNPDRDVIKVLCTLMGSDYETIVSKCVEKLREKTDFPENPKNGDVCGYFVYEEGYWVVVREA